MSDGRNNPISSDEVVVNLAIDEFLELLRRRTCRSGWTVNEQRTNKDIGMECVEVGLQRSVPLAKTASQTRVVYVE